MEISRIGNPTTCISGRYGVKNMEHYLRLECNSLDSNERKGKKKYETPPFFRSREGNGKLFVKYGTTEKVVIPEGVRILNNGSPIESFGVDGNLGKLVRIVLNSCNFDGFSERRHPGESRGPEV